MNQVENNENFTSDAEETRVAGELGISPITLRLWQALGCPVGHWLAYQTRVNSLSDVGTAFGVSERTAATWRSKGMPGSREDGYPIQAIRDWRAGNNKRESENHVARFVDAIFRFFRTEIIESGVAAHEDIASCLDGRDDAEELSELFAAAMIRRFERLRLTDEDIARVMQDCREFIQIGNLEKF